MGGRFGHNRRGRRALELAYAWHRGIPGLPQRVRFALADRLMRWAMRLRGEKVSTFGFYDYGRGNRAAVLIDRVDDYLVLESSPKNPDALADARESLEELASLAGACWYRNDGREEDAETGKLSL